jgi:nucleoside 2-deoxyribosyltransferase
VTELDGLFCICPLSQTSDRAITDEQLESDERAPETIMRIYLAGPDVFLADAKAIGRAKARLCEDAGFTGCFPLDAPLDLADRSKTDAAQLIFAACETMMQSCDACLANCTPFRGVSMDAGTAYEIGYMRARGKPVFGYSASKLVYAERTINARRFGAIPPQSDRADAEIEDFDQAENLMIARAAAASGLDIVTVHETGDEALAAMAAFRKALAAVALWHARRP